MSVGDAFSAGLGMAMGLVMGQYMLQAIRPEKAKAKRVIVCQRCSAWNPVGNKFCGNCGQSLYPPPRVTCKKCCSTMPATMKFCGNCGSALQT